MPGDLPPEDDHPQGAALKRAHSRRPRGPQAPKAPRPAGPQGAGTAGPQGAGTAGPARPPAPAPRPLACGRVCRSRPRARPPERAGRRHRQADGQPGWAERLKRRLSSAVCLPETLRSLPSPCREPKRRGQPREDKDPALQGLPGREGSRGARARRARAGGCLRPHAFRLRPSRFIAPERLRRATKISEMKNPGYP